MTLPAGCRSEQYCLFQARTRRLGPGPLRGQKIRKEGVDDRGDRRVRANTERQRQYRYGRKAAILRQNPQAVFQILNQRSRVLPRVLRGIRSGRSITSYEF